jgi:hypothetical protein
MPKDEQEPLIDTERPTDKKRKPWFGPNRSGAGWRPYTLAGLADPRGCRRRDRCRCRAAQEWGAVMGLSS